MRFGAFGDLVQTTPLLEDLAQRWGRPCDLLAAHGWPKAVLLGLPFVGEVCSLDSRRKPFLLSRSQRRAVRWLAARGPSPTWLFEPKARPAAKARWLLRRSGVPPGWLVDGEVDELRRKPLEHSVDYLLRVGRMDPVDSPDASSAPLQPDPLPRLHVADEEREDCARWLQEHGWAGRPVILLQTQSRRANRGRWPASRWREAIREVAARVPEAVLLLSGSPRERRALEDLRRRCSHPGVAVATEDLPLRRLFALMLEAHSCISLDTGPAHAAAALGCPVVVLAGMADPRRCRPIGLPGRVGVVASIPDGSWPGDPFAWQAMNRMEEIPVEAVIRAWERVTAAEN